MDAVKFIDERNRMCKSFGRRCNDCPANKKGCCDAYEWQEELVTIVEEWSASHPIKTRQSVFLAQYPEAKCSENGTLVICPALLSSDYGTSTGGCRYLGMNCPDCLQKFWEHEV